MFFEKTTWRNFLTQWRAVTRQLVHDNERLMTEHAEWLGKMQEQHEEKEMIKKLARNQVQELEQAWEKGFKFEQLYNEAERERKLLKDGVSSSNGAIRALTILEVQKAAESHAATFAPAILKIVGKTVVDIEQGPDCEREYALNQAKITFTQLFDPDEMGIN